MKAECTDNKTFQLTDNDQLAGKLVYKSLFSYKAEIILPDDTTYEIQPAGFFGTSVRVTKAGNDIAELKMNWKGQIVINYQDGEEYIFKPKGLFHNKYVIGNKDGEELIWFDPKFNWGKFNYNYEIAFDKRPSDLLFILIGIYASNYYIAMMSGAGA